MCGLTLDRRAFERGLNRAAAEARRLQKAIRKFDRDAEKRMKVRAKVLIISPWGKAKPGDDNDGVLDIKDERVARSLIQQGKAEAVEEPKADAAAEAPKPKRGK